MNGRKIRYAVVGLGHIAQTAMLPAFKNARKNSELVALVSSDPLKLRKIGRKYKVPFLCSYDEYADLMGSCEVDAVYIATPNSTHRAFADVALSCGVHVLCEKPLSTYSEDCLAMIETARRNKVQLMTAYRLHFEAANLEAIQVVRSHRLGDPKIFNSVFTMQVKDPDNIRLKKRLGGGTLHDLGVYCINAARYLFQAEPIEVFASSLRGEDPRFQEIDEITSAVLVFPDDRIATFTTSFGAADASDYEVIGTEGRLKLEHAYDYAEPMKLSVTKDGRTSHRRYPQRDQFSAELIYFSDCLLNHRRPEPSGEEGLLDVQIIEALQQSAKSGRSVRYHPFLKQHRPSPKQRITRPGINPPSTVHVTSPGGGS